MQSGQGFQGVFLLLILVRGGAGNGKNILFLLCIHRAHPRKESFGASQGRSGISPPPRPHKDPRCVASGALAASLVSGLWPSAGKGIAVSSR